MSTKGALIYLVLTFVLGYTAQILGFKTGILRLDNSANLFNYLAFLPVMFIPAFCAWLASRFEKRGNVTGGAYWPLPMGKALCWVLAMPLIFFLLYGLTVLAGTSTLNWSMGGLAPQVNDILRGMDQPVMNETIRNNIFPIVALVAGIPFFMALGVTLFAAYALGGEIGWRGYLLPRLMPMGRIPAHVLTGLLLGAWFLPCLYTWLNLNAHLKSDAWIFLTQLLAMAVVMSVVLGEVWLRSRHMLLTALVFGSFLGQQLGVLSYLFESPRRPWAGGMGFIALAVWLFIAIIMLFTGRGKTAETAD